MTRVVQTELADTIDSKLPDRRSRRRCTNVYASLPDGVSRYTANGVLIGKYDNIGVNKFGALALAPSAMHEPMTWTLLLFGFGATGAVMRGRSTSVRLALAA